jgi:import inner membrane translocase subunit TIM23
MQQVPGPSSSLNLHETSSLEPNHVVDSCAMPRLLHTFAKTHGSSPARKVRKQQAASSHHAHSHHQTTAPRVTMLTRSALCPARAFASRFPPAILAPCAATGASFSTCTRPTKLPQPAQAPLYRPRIAFPAKVAMRNASSSPSQPAASPASSAQTQLTWNDFFALRRTRRRIGQACSGVGAIGVSYYGLTTMISNGYDSVLSAQLGGFDPVMLMGMSTVGMLAVGWLIGPIFGNQIFNLAYRGVIAEFGRVGCALVKLITSVY